MKNDADINPTGKGSVITPQEAQKILADQGMHVTIEQAQEILEFLTRLADIALNNRNGHQ